MGISVAKNCIDFATQEQFLLCADISTNLCLYFSSVTAISYFLSFTITCPADVSHKSRRYSSNVNSLWKKANCREMFDRELVSRALVTKSRHWHNRCPGASSVLTYPQCQWWPQCLTHPCVYVLLRVVCKTYVFHSLSRLWQMVGVLDIPTNSNICKLLLFWHNIVCE